MIGAIPFTNGGRRLYSFTKHGTELNKLAAFARTIQQEFTIAKVPFCELRDREILQGEALLEDGYGMFSKVIITFFVNGERYGFPIYAPRSSILEPVKMGRHQTKLRVTSAAGQQFAAMYPADDVEFETGWLCR